MFDGVGSTALVLEDLPSVQHEGRLKHRQLVFVLSLAVEPMFEF